MNDPKSVPANAAVTVTAGSWEVFENGFGLGVLSNVDGDVCYAPPIGSNSERSRDEDRANMKLIAAAKDLLATVRWYANATAAQIDGDSGDKARETLAKVQL